MFFEAQKIIKSFDKFNLKTQFCREMCFLINIVRLYHNPLKFFAEAFHIHHYLNYFLSYV